MSLACSSTLTKHVRIKASLDSGQGHVRGRTRLAEPTFWVDNQPFHRAASQLPVNEGIELLQCSAMSDCGSHFGIEH